MNRQHAVRLATFALIALTAANAFAAGSGMPWESPLNRILDSITGPVVKVIGVLSIVLVGWAISNNEGGGFMHKLLCVAMGLCIAFSASTFFLSFFGYAGGVGF